jgi:AcrR family transcriptional regulator
MGREIRRGAAAVGVDPRASRASEAMTLALIAIVNNKELSEITVSELCEKAGVHRTTFYGHYPDIFALAAGRCRSLLDQLVTARDAGPEPVPQMLAHILAHRPSYRLAFGRMDVGFRMGLYDRARLMLSDRTGDPLLATFLAGGLLSTLEEWTEGESTDIAGYTDAIFRAFGEIEMDPATEGDETLAPSLGP